MSSPPLTTREYAYLSIMGNGTHQEITEILGIEPSLAWNAGEKSEHNGRTQKLMHWKKNSGLDDKESLENHIEAIFFLLSRKQFQNFIERQDMKISSKNLNFPCFHVLL